MLSSRRICTLARDAMRDSVEITYNAQGALIAYQASFVGLDKKFRKLMLSEFFGGATRNRTGDEGFADLCLTAWLWRRTTITQYKREQEINDNNSRPLNYLLSLAEIWSGLRGSNPPPRPWQGRALPNELNPHFPKKSYPSHI